MMSNLAANIPAQSDTRDPRREVAVTRAWCDWSSILVTLLNRVMSLRMRKTL